MQQYYLGSVMIKDDYAHAMLYKNIALKTLRSETHAHHNYFIDSC